MIKIGLDTQLNFELSMRRADDTDAIRQDTLMAEMTGQLTGLILQMAQKVMEQERIAAEQRKASSIDGNQIGAAWNNRGTVQ